MRSSDLTKTVCATDWASCDNFVEKSQSSEQDAITIVSELNAETLTSVSDVDKSWLSSLPAFVSDHEKIFQSGVYNFEMERIPLETHLNIDFFKFMLSDYHDQDLCTFLEFGFPIGFQREFLSHIGSGNNINHKGAIDFPSDIDLFLQKEIDKQAVLGPFQSNPFSHNCVISPLNSVPKKGTTQRRVILKCSRG